MVVSTDVRDSARNADAGEFAIGRPARRKEDRRLLTGRACYVDDIVLPRQAFAFVLHSPVAHARIASIDIDNAAAAPGVLLVLTGADAEAEGLGGIPCTQLLGDGGWLKGYRTHQPLLAAGRVRHVGDRVALVVAETLSQARDAAELIKVAYEPLPIVTSVTEATQPGAPLVWDGAPNNIGFEMAIGDKAAVDKTFQDAHHVQRLTVHNNRLSASAMEPRGTIGVYDDGRYTLYTSCQKPHTVRQLLANAIFHTVETDFQVICRDVGGGFGLKGTMYPEDALVLWAAAKVERPVKWIGDRHESLLSDIHGRDQIDAGELAFDDAGRILGLRVSVTANLGAYLSVSALVPTVRCVLNLSNVYAIPAMHVTARSVFTHTTPMGPYRGAGMPEAVYAIERLMDDAAREMGIDAAELRRRNLIASSAMPYKTPLQYVYDAGEFETVLERSLQVADWEGFASRRTESERRGKLRGIGIGFYLEAITPFSERMEIRVDSSGGVTVLAGTFSYGQGHDTVYAQMLFEWLGVPPDKVRLVQGDTDRVSLGRGSFGSRSMTMGGSALKRAADQVIEKGKRIAAHLLEASEADIVFEKGNFKVSGTDRSRSLREVAGASFAPVGLPRGSGIGLEGTGYYDGPFNFPNGCHVCEVEVDIETGQVELLRYTATDDVGVAINPLLVEGQLTGGIVQGLGQALMENVLIDRGSGQLLSRSLLDYALPRASDMPAFDICLHESPTTSNPIGVKGAGENGCLSSPPAAINAILDALRPLGVTEIGMPATPERVWQAIRAAKI